jgi:hypothetical protein
MKKTLGSRHLGGSVELKEGTGQLTAMCACGDFLEMYKADKTFRVKTPESIDPDETNPNCPWIASPVSDVGSSSPIVARVLLQGRQILESAALEVNVDKEAVVMKLHACKECLVVCENVSRIVVGHIERIINEINAKGVPVGGAGRVLNPFPQVPNLEADCGIFLVQANRAIKLICELPSLFLPIKKLDTNFDHLSKTLDKPIGSNTPLTVFVKSNAAAVCHLVNLRNFHEHPRELKTVIENFLFLPEGKVQVPTWYVSDQAPMPIKEEMPIFTQFIVQLAEVMLIHLVMQTISKKWPFIVIQVPDSEVDPAVPIRYRLSLDLSKLSIK